MLGKICLKGNKNHNLRCPLQWIRVSCGCGRGGDSQLAELVAGTGTGGIFGLGGAAGTQEGSSSPLAFPGAQIPFAPSRNPPEPSGAPPFPGLSRPGISPCTSAGWREQLWSCRSCTGAAGAAQELQPQTGCCWGSRDGGWSFEPNADFNLNHKSLDPGFIFEGRFFLLLLFCLFFFLTRLLHNKLE